jgi:hypothetical protein
MAEYSSGTVVYVPEYRLLYLFEKTLNFICEYKKDAIHKKCSQRFLAQHTATAASPVAADGGITVSESYY